MSEGTPDRYTPAPRQWEQKDWLYEKYWGEMLTSDEIAEQADVCGHTIRETMDKLGIPKRTHWSHKPGVSPFTGFYDDDQAPAPDPDPSHHDEAQAPGGEEYEREWLNWEHKDAEMGSGPSDGTTPDADDASDASRGGNVDYDTMVDWSQAE